MSMSLILLWFPIVLAVGVGARLVLPTRGVWFGVLGATFWLVLVFAEGDVETFLDAWTLLALSSGAVAIAAIGAWSSTDRGEPNSGVSDVPDSAMAEEASSKHSYVGGLTETFLAFDDWLEAHRHSEDPWPEFGEFLRIALNRLTGATHVHPYRILSEDDALVPLRAIGPGELMDIDSARCGIVGHVATTGRAYVENEQAHGELVDQLARQSGEPVAWCFAISQGTRRIGLLKIGSLSAGAACDPEMLTLAQNIVSSFWVTLGEVCRRRTAEIRDPLSGLLARESFLFEADRTLSAAYVHNEPVAVGIVAVEGIRLLCDRGDWDLADALAAEAALLLGERVRTDDCIGRFDDSRFVVLLRRVDSALGALIIEQLHKSFSDLCSDGDRWRVPLVVRCGVSGSGTEQPPLRELISRAINRCHEARARNVALLSDVASPETSASVIATAGVKS